MPQRPSTSTPLRHIAAAAAVEVSLAAEGSPVKRLQLMPLGKVELRDGRGPFKVEDPHAQIETTRGNAGNTHLVVDYDHQHHFGVKPGVAAQAPAAGWIDPASLRVEDDGIWADVEWTAAAADKLRAREYRYVSPLFAFDEKSGAVLAILNASLTNVPAIEALAAAASADLTTDPQEIDNMLLAKIAAALGLADSATEEEVMQSLAALKDSSAGMASASAAVAAAAAQLGLPATATVAEVAAAAVAAKADPDPKLYAPVSAVTALQAQLAELQKDKAAGIVAAAMEAGKVSPALKDWAINFATTDPAGFNDYLDKAPVILQPGAQLAAAAAQAGADGLTDAERATAAMLGVPADKFLAAKKAN